MQNHFELIRIFAIAAEAESFRDAAAILGKSPQVITRAIKELETLRQETLFYRSTRKRKLTIAGEKLAINAKDMVNKIDELVTPNIIEDHENITGNISLTLPVSLGRHIVMPVLNLFQKQYPNISLTCTFTDSHSDVVNEKIDIGLRAGFLYENRYVAKKIRDVHFYILGTPELINKTGIPEYLDELVTMPIIALHDYKTGRPWPWHFNNAKNFNPVDIRFMTDDLDAYIDSMLNSTGYGRLSDYLAVPLIKKGLLIPVLEKYQSPPWGLYIYRPQRGPIPKRVRLLFDYLCQQLKHLDSL